MSTDQSTGFDEAWELFKRYADDPTRQRPDIVSVIAAPIVAAVLRGQANRLRAESNPYATTPDEARFDVAHDLDDLADQLSPPT